MKLKLPQQSLLIILFLCSIFFIKPSLQLIAQSEFDSVIFILRQYGSPIQPQIDLICTDYRPNITCNLNQIYEISLTIDQYVYTGPLNTSLQSLSLPFLTKLEIKLPSLGATVTSQSVNILKMLESVMQSPLSFLSISNDPSLTYLPPLLFTIIVKVTLINCPIMDYTPLYPPIYSTQYFLQSIIIAVPDSITNYILFPSYQVQLSSLKTLSFTAASFPTVLNITEFSVPTLENLYINSRPGSSGGTTDIYCPSASTITLLNYGSSIFNLYISLVSRVGEFYFAGPNIKVIPPIDESYTNLDTLSYSNTPINSVASFPWDKLPSSLTLLELNSSLNMPYLTNIVLPSNLDIFVTTNNNISSIDWTIFNNPTTAMVVNLSNNTNLSGTIPNNFCSDVAFLTIRNTSFTPSQIPDCYWCWINDRNMPLNTDLAIPNNITCNITLDSHDLILKNGVGYISGNNLGYGIVSQVNSGSLKYVLSPEIPNTYLSFRTSTTRLRGPFQEFNIALSLDYPEYNQTMRLLEVGVIVQGVILVRLGQDKIQFNSTMVLLNDYLTHSILLNGTIPCPIIYQDQKLVNCQIDHSLPTGLMSFYISNQYGGNFTSAFYYNNSAPLIVSAEYDTNNRKNISLFGEFGTNQYGSPSVTLNDSMSCTIIYIDTKMINCLLENEPAYGPADVTVVVNYNVYIGSSMLYFPAPPRTKEQCQIQTLNCHQHGQCNDNGICVCDQNYNPNDDCITRFANTTINTNSTSPTSSFNIDGIKFDFELASIQELNIDGQILKELLTSNWTVNITSLTDQNNGNNSTIAIYTIQPTNNFEGVNVIANISFSSNERDIQFGPEILHINPNSIKISVSVNNWNYTYILSTLRVVFKTVINNDELIDNGCNGGDDGSSVTSFTYDEYGSTLQYLRVVKDNVQFSGRFIDFVLSDGRPTYSRTTIINQTTINGDDEDLSIVMIGVNLPQCSDCLLDPDFTPLLIDKTQECTTESKSKWGVIVGAVVGAVAGAAILIASAMLIIKKISIRNQHKSIQMKLNSK